VLKTAMSMIERYVSCFIKQPNGLHRVVGTTRAKTIAGRSDVRYGVSIFIGSKEEVDSMVRESVWHHSFDGTD